MTDKDLTGYTPSPNSRTNNSSSANTYPPRAYSQPNTYNNSHTSRPNGNYTKPVYDKKFPPKKVIAEKRNNTNNKVLFECLRENKALKVHINNLLCSDTSLSPSYEGTVVSFDDYTLLLKTSTGSFLINKSAITIIAILS
jgi:sRNA-binding regulator protein Hfq